MEENTKTPGDADDPKKREASSAQNYVAPGVPIVRASTPRPAPFFMPAKTELPPGLSGKAPAFPSQAPEAPPLPEEAAHPDESLAETKAERAPQLAADQVSGGQTPRSPANEFIWLFEYALDMDPVLLNRPERLNGSAFAYGPALLKGYRLVFEGLNARTGQVVASLSQAPDAPDAEVWGVLYRVPRRLAGGEVSLLAKAHDAETFVPVEVQVREPYRQREITCVTYVASPATRAQVGRLPQRERLPEPAYFKHLLRVARRQKLPASYLQTLENLLPASIPAASALPMTPPDQDTEPLPAVVRRSSLPRSSGAVTALPIAKFEARQSSWRRSSLESWLIAFGLYVCLLLLATLILAIYQGLNFWPEVFNNAFTPLGVPWYVFLYGLLGGCVSCIITLNRLTPGSEYPPIFVVLTWFARPFFGATLGAFAYLLLNSGAILLSAQPAQHFALCSIVGALAGLCEGKLLAGAKGLRASA